MTCLSVSQDAGLAHVRLARGPSGNVLDLELIEALRAAFTGLDATSVRAVLISAEGANFCVGGDLRGMDAAPDRGAMLRAMADPFHEGLRALDALGVPVVAAVNGVAAGGGLSLALAGDLIVGGAGSGYMMAYTAIGLSCDGGASHRLPRLVGLRLAQEMAYLNRRLDANEALAAGLITRIVPDETLLDEATALARRLAAGPTAALRRMKRLFGDWAQASLSAQFDAEAEAIAACAAGHDGGEGVRAFLERRKPAFTGD